MNHFPETWHMAAQLRIIEDLWDAFQDGWVLRVVICD
jgi:hypothetical protein